MIEEKKSELIETSLIYMLSAVVAALGFLLVWVICTLAGFGRTWNTGSTKVWKGVSLSDRLLGRYPSGGKHPSHFWLLIVDCWLAARYRKQKSAISNQNKQSIKTCLLKLNLNQSSLDSINKLIFSNLCLECGGPAPLCYSETQRSVPNILHAWNIFNCRKMCWRDHL